MRKPQQLTFPGALEAVLSGYEVRSYDEYVLSNRKGNVYCKHVHSDIRPRLINHDEIKLLMNKKFYIVGDTSWESYTTSLFVGE